MNRFWRFISLLIAALVAVPIVSVLITLFGEQTKTWQHLQQTVLGTYIINTVLLMLGVGVLVTIFGVISAWLVAAYKFPGRGFFRWALMLPMAAPAYIVAYIYTDLLNFSGPLQTFFRQITGLKAGDYYDLPVRSLPGAIIILALVLYPYVYLLTRNAFELRSNTLFEAARSLGASPFRAFWQVALPAARPAIIGGLALALMETLADFGVVDYFGIPTFSTGIFRTWLSMGEKLAAMKLAAIMFVFVAILVGVEKFSKKQDTSSRFNRDANIVSMQLSPLFATMATIFCFSLVFLGCIVPLFALLYFTLQTASFSLNEFVYAFNTLKVSLIAVLFTVLSALILSLTQRFNNKLLGNGIISIATLGYSLPGALLAIGLLSPLGNFDRWLVGLLNQYFQLNTGLFLTGAIGVVIYAYMVRFLTVAYNTTSSSLLQISPLYDQIGRSLGASPWRMVLSLHLPLLRRSIITACLLVFVDCVRELPATMLLRPANFETLATRVHRLASDERLSEAATSSLLIFIIGLILVLLLNRLNKVKQ